MLKSLRLIVIGIGLFAAGGTLISFHKSTHWFVRLWDFPRVQLSAMSAFSASVFGALFFRRRDPAHWLFQLANALCLAWHGKEIFPYTPLAKKRVQRSRGNGGKGRSIRLLISNVRMENRSHHRLLEEVRANDPDIVLALETDFRWAKALEPLGQRYPHSVRHPQENYYGLMLFSRFPLIDPRVEFLVQPDIPSVHAGVKLPCGERVFLHGLHPRPPEPIRGQKSTPRDAEIILMGRAIRDAGDRPTIVVGDLNDVAWSPTSELFLRLSGLLDPRMGRGFFNSFNADSRIMRYPLDHVFHSSHFRICNLRLLPNIGSDHFPVLIELSYEPEAQAEQVTPPLLVADEQEAQEKIEQQHEEAKTGEDRPARE